MAIRTARVLCRVLFYEDDVTHSFGERRAYSPRWLFKDDDALLRVQRCDRFASLADFCRKRQPRTVCLHRTYALGDVLMLLPVARAFRRHFKLPEPIMLATASGIIDQLRGLRDGGVRLVRSLGTGREYGADVHLDLNSCLELDHRGGPESDVHRLDLYARELGLRISA